MLFTIDTLPFQNIRDHTEPPFSGEGGWGARISLYGLERFFQENILTSPRKALEMFLKNRYSNQSSRSADVQ